MSVYFRFHERDQWHSRDETPPPGDYLVSDGVDTWVIERYSGDPFATLRYDEIGRVRLGPDSQVRWWRPLYLQQAASPTGVGSNDYDIALGTVEE